MLEQIDRADTNALDAVWNRLAAFLEVHAAAEEEHFYPALLRLGKDAGGKSSADDEMEDAIHDHNEIRDAVTAVRAHAVGSDEWFKAIADANEANGDAIAPRPRRYVRDIRGRAHYRGQRTRQRSAQVYRRTYVVDGANWPGVRIRASVDDGRRRGDYECA